MAVIVQQLEQVNVHYYHVLLPLTFLTAGKFQHLNMNAGICSSACVFHERPQTSPFRDVLKRSEWSFFPLIGITVHCVGNMQSKFRHRGQRNRFSLS